MTKLTPEQEQMKNAVNFYLENSTIKSNGIREVRKADFVEAMKKHGVTADDYKKVQDALDYEVTAAAGAALVDTENKIKEASADDLKNEEYRKSLSSVVRLPTFGGSTEVECRAEKHSNIPFRGDADGNGEPAVKIDYGRFRTTINTKGRIHKDLHAEAVSRIKSALKVKD